MLRHERQVQDENAGVFTDRHLDGKRTQQTPMKKHTGRSGTHTGLASSKKAFGNITNCNTQPGFQTELKGQQTTRRALGDITNATPQPRKSAPVAAAEPAQAVSGVQSAACAQDVADLYAEEGTERCAGMTWDQQEALRERQQDAEIAARVRAFNSVPYRMPLPYLPRSALPGEGLQETVRSVLASPLEKLDLDCIQPEAFMLQLPALDWTFGGVFPETTSEAVPAEQGSDTWKQSS